MTHTHRRTIMSKPKNPQATSNPDREAGGCCGPSPCSRYLEWLETAAERETKKAVAKKQDGELVVSAFADGVATGLLLAASEFSAGGIYSANTQIAKTHEE
jgi:hypothetical protein